MKKWKVKHNFESDFNTEQIIKILLKNRRIKTKKAIREFLYPDLSQITSSALNLKKNELKKAIRRIKTAIDEKESIIVYTDYDADGIVSGAIIWETLFDLGAKVMPYVPRRIEEGYGLSLKGIDEVKKKYKTSLIVTVDHGVSAFSQIEYAKRKGIEVIVLDHHLLPGKSPHPHAMVHTTKMAAAGLAWFFSRLLYSEIGIGINKKEKGETIRQNLALAALGTVADLVPLYSVNRAIVKFGLIELNKTERIGLLALIRASGLHKGELGVYEIGHMLTPRINAAGRMAHALEALRLLCTRDKERAENIAKSLTEINYQRQLVMQEATNHALGSLDISLEKEISRDDKLIFVSHKSYQQGIIGLVAGRLAEQYGRPAIVVSEGDKYSKASARSIKGFNIITAIRKGARYLKDIGGHPMAAGFTVETKKLPRLKVLLTEIVNRELKTELMMPQLDIDMILDIGKIDYNLYQVLQTLSPYGVGNSQPTFLSKNIRVVGVTLVGRDKKHLKMKLASPDGSVFYEAIGFGMGEIYHQISSGENIDVVYTIGENSWNGRKSLQLKIRDVKFPPT